MREQTMAERRIGRTVFTMPSDREVAATRVLSAPRRLLWDALTKPEHLPNWMLYQRGWTMPACELDLRPGGVWRLVWRDPDGRVLEMRGEFREVTPPERLVHTEVWGGDWPDTLNTLVLSEGGGRTTLAATVLFASREVRDRALETPLLEGWAASHDRLERYLQMMACANGRPSHSGLSEAA
jgi:uncharacterized protein YndB with AHSA1/START domain